MQPFSMVEERRVGGRSDGGVSTTLTSSSFRVPSDQSVHCYVSSPFCPQHPGSAHPLTTVAYPECFASRASLHVRHLVVWMQRRCATAARTVWMALTKSAAVCIINR